MPFSLLFDGHSPQGQAARLFKDAPLLLEHPKIVTTCLYVWMIRGQDLLANRQGSSEEWLSLCELVLHHIESAEIVEGKGDPAVCRPLGLLEDSERPLIQRLGDKILSLVVIQLPQIVAGGSDLEVVRAEDSHSDDERTAQQGFRLSVSFLPPVQLAEVVQGGGRPRIYWAPERLPGFPSLLQPLFRLVILLPIQIERPKIIQGDSQTPVSWLKLFGILQGSEVELLALAVSAFLICRHPGTPGSVPVL